MGLAALILTGFVSVAAIAAELPKEGTFATTTYFHDSYDAVEAAPKSYMWTYDDYGIITNDSGSGFTHKMVIHCNGTGANTNNAGGKRNVDHCVLVDSDGGTGSRLRPKTRTAGPASHRKGRRHSFLAVANTRASAVSSNTPFTPLTPPYQGPP